MIEQNITQVEGLALSQDDKPGGHESQREIAAHAGLPRSSVKRIITEDLRSTNFRIQKVQQLSDDHQL